METIEEAWAALDVASGQRMKLDKAAARVLGLAVLEALAPFQGRSGWQGFDKVRARIERLGE